MAERCECSTEAAVYIWDGLQWVKHGSELSTIDVLYHPFAQTFRVVASDSEDDFVMNCYLHDEANYHAESDYFHIWKGYDGVSYGLAFQTNEKAQLFLERMSAICQEVVGVGDEDWIPPEASPLRNSASSSLLGPFIFYTFQPWLHQS